MYRTLNEVHKLRCGDLNVTLWGDENQISVLIWAQPITWTWIKFQASGHQSSAYPGIYLLRFLYHQSRALLAASMPSLGHEDLFKALCDPMHLEPTPLTSNHFPPFSLAPILEESYFDPGEVALISNPILLSGC